MAQPLQLLQAAASDAMHNGAPGLVLAALGCVLLAQLASWCLTFARTKAFLRTSTIPGPPPAHWLLGHMKFPLDDRVPQQLAEAAALYGPIFKLQVLNAPVIVITSPAAILELVRGGPGSANYITRDPALYHTLELGSKPRRRNILTSAEDGYWRAVRQGVAPCFSASNLRKVYPWVQLLCGKAERHASSLLAAAAPAHAELDVIDLCKRFGCDVMGHLLFGEDMGCLDMQPNTYLALIHDVMEEVHHSFGNAARHWMFWSADAMRGRRLIDAHARLIASKLAALRKQPPPSYTITGHLMRVVDPSTGRPLSDEQLRAEIAIMMGAGWETTSITAAMALAALAVHPEAQERLAAELAAAGLAPGAGGAPPRRVEWADLGQLRYLTAVIRETLRLFSPTGLQIRFCSSPVQALGHTLPKGAWVVTPPWAAGLSAANYGPSARRFVPERWLLDDADQPQPGADVQQQQQQRQPLPGSRLQDNLPFSAGPRDCIGQTLAKAEIAALLATLVGRFRLHPSTSLAAELRDAAAASGSDEDFNPADVLQGKLIYRVTLFVAGDTLPLRLQPR